MLIHIDTFLGKYFSPGDKILLACSSGVDSMVLLDHVLQSAWKSNIVICHFNHGTRPECMQEEKYLQELSQQHSLEIEIASCDFEALSKLYPSKSFEELAREKRYQFFEAIMHMYQSKQVLLAHHRDDRVETALFHLARGTKLSGLINMKESSRGILRPFLSVGKSSILNYAQENNIRYFEDATNTDITITRNFIRHRVLPQFGEIHPQASENTAHFLNYAQELQDFIDQSVVGFLDSQSRVTQKRCFILDAFVSQQDFLQKEIIRYLYFTANDNSTIGLSRANIAEILKFLHGPYGNTSKVIGKLQLYKKQGIIRY